MQVTKRKTELVEQALINEEITLIPDRNVE